MTKALVIINTLLKTKLKMINNSFIIIYDLIEHALTAFQTTQQDIGLL